MSLDPTPPPQQEIARVVGAAIQDLAAARLGRGFVPLALLLLVGLGRMMTDTPGGLVLAVGAPLSAGAMLGYGLGVVQRAFGRPTRPWMWAAAAAGAIPSAFGVFVLGWEGLRGLAQASGVFGAAGSAVMATLGIWALRGWLQILELRRLGEAMGMGFHEGHGRDE